MTKADPTSSAGGTLEPNLLYETPFLPQGDVLALDWRAIAERVRGLVRVQHSADISLVARRLGVSELSLRASFENAQHPPSLDLLTAIVKTYGLDPSWVLTGAYDASTHRVALENNTDEIRITLHKLLLTASETESKSDGASPTGN